MTTGDGAVNYQQNTEAEKIENDESDKTNELKIMTLRGQ